MCGKMGLMGHCDAEVKPAQMAEAQTFVLNERASFCIVYKIYEFEVGQGAQEWPC